MYIKSVSILLVLVLSCTISTQSSNEKKDDDQKPATQSSSQNKKPKKLATASKVLATEKEPQDKIQEKTKRCINVRNAITPEMTKYRFWGTDYEPTELYLTINDKKLKKNETVECSVNNNNYIEITYHYEFKNGMVTGSKSIEFEIFENKSSIDITFSWKKNHRLICSGGRAVRSKKSIMKSSCSYI